jgi:hypothetical protein
MAPIWCPKRNLMNVCTQDHAWRSTCCATSDKASGGGRRSDADACSQLNREHDANSDGVHDA